jgi:hypothetical protein
LGLSFCCYTNFACSVPNKTHQSYCFFALTYERNNVINQTGSE